MRVKTVAVGTPRTVTWKGEDVVTSIFKSALPFPVMIRRHNLDGDHQADVEAHGGEYKAVYAYAAEHYPWWEHRLGRRLEPAHFGENLTISGLDEPSVCIGDILRVGEAELEAIAPRIPCYKLAIRFRQPRMVKWFAQSRRWGVYFRIVTEGYVQAGDRVAVTHRDPRACPVYEVARVHLFDRDDVAALERLAAHQRLDPRWRAHFARKLEQRRES